MKPAVSIRPAGERPRRPPFVDLLFDVTFRNQGARPEWFALPVYLHQPHEFVAAGAEIVSCAGAPAKWARFFGSGAFHAFLLAPGAELTVRGLPVSSASEPGPGARFQIVHARALSFESARAADWLPVDITCQGQIEVDYSSPRQEGAKDTRDRKECAALVDTVEALEVRI